MENRNRFIEKANQLVRLGEVKNATGTQFDSSYNVNFKQASEGSIEDNVFEYNHDQEFVGHLIALANASKVEPIQEYVDKLLGELGIDPDTSFKLEMI